MEIGRRIRERRAEAGMSQDDLAGRVYVSRQTISSWENDKTYPDVQSLLLLSEIFGVTVDSLIKGDVETMAQTIDNDALTLRRLSWTMTAFLLLSSAAMGWWVAQYTSWDWAFEQTVPTLLLTIVLWGVAMAASVWADRIKRERDLVTYQEIVDFYDGRPVDRDTERGRRERSLSSRMRALRTVGMVALSAAIGFACAYVGFELVRALLG